MSNHTPGPWYWNSAYNGLVGDDGDDVLHYEPYEGMWLEWGPRREANASLIAAAPDMLSALQSALHLCDGTPLTEAQRDGVADELRAAIAKAEGRS